MIKYFIYASMLLAPTLYADADFCVEDKPCESTIPCLYCPTSYYGNVDDLEALRQVNTWPGKKDDPFLEALSR